MNQYIFTPTGFYPDTQEKETLEKRYETLYHMGFSKRSKEMSSSELFLYELSETFFRCLTEMPELELTREATHVVPDEEHLEHLLSSVPYAIGAEYIDRKWIAGVFSQLEQIFQREISGYKGSVELYLTEQNQKLHVPERIFLHLVENKDGEDPFVFMATYASLGEDHAVHHMPLKYALTEYQDDRDKLLALLSCLNRAAEVSDLIAELVESGEMFHVLRFTGKEAYQFLRDVEKIEQTGILCRIPNWWRKKAMECSVEIRLGEKKPAMVGFDALVSMQPQLCVDGEALTKKDVELLLAQTEGLAFLKGKWVEVNHKKLRELLKRMDGMDTSITLREALQMEIGNGKKVSADVGALVTNGAWLSKMLRNLRKPSGIRSAAVPKTVHATLRPYQKDGYTWLNYMQKLGFGACLADDMGLGKTLQVISLLLAERQDYDAGEKERRRSLIVCPASLVYNWQKEIERFAPELETVTITGSAPERKDIIRHTTDGQILITSYDLLKRDVEYYKNIVFAVQVIDEAQYIKNAGTQAAKGVKKITAAFKLALTGTPIENRLSELWSIFDYLMPGFLYTYQKFREEIETPIVVNKDENKMERLQRMIRPFILRRLKGDVLKDLPEKLEENVYAKMEGEQLALYDAHVQQMKQMLDGKSEAEFKSNKIQILAELTKLRQLCCDPALLFEDYKGESAKVQMCMDLIGNAVHGGHKVLLFSQFTTMLDRLAEQLKKLGIDYYMLTGSVNKEKRMQMVDSFNKDDVPVFCISLKAGGTGLNLTAADIVIHYDPWWNVAVQNQATDRAHRIGQKNVVTVYKLVSQGTIEEKIIDIQEKKKKLAEQVLEGEGMDSVVFTKEEIMELLG